MPTYCKFKAILSILVGKYQSTTLSAYLGFKRKEGYKTLVHGWSRFVGPPNFLDVCGRAVQKALSVDREFLQPLLEVKGVLLFPEDPQIGFYSNQIYGRFCVSESYLAYEEEGFVALLVFIAFLKKEQIFFAGWETAIPTKSKNEIMQDVANWLSKYSFNPQLVQTFQGTSK